MRAEERIAVISAMVLMLLPFVHADFPYSADWLNYADIRIVYQIDTSGITSNTANIYVTVSIDPTTLQNYINKWSDFCDPVGRYDWFWPTFTYASTANQTERMLQIVEYNNFQTFTVGACGTVDIPTQFTLLLPNGVLDGGTDYAAYQHYVYAYLKYPYVDDFYDNPVGFPPEEYNIIGGTPTISFSSQFMRGHFVSHSMTATRPIEFYIDLSSNNPFLFCGYYDFEYPTYVQFEIDGNYITIAGELGNKCVDVRNALINKGYTGMVHVTSIKLVWPYGAFEGFDGDWIWLIPQQIYKQIAYGS